MYRRRLKVLIVIAVCFAAACSKTENEGTLGCGERPPEPWELEKFEWYGWPKSNWHYSPENKDILPVLDGKCFQIEKAYQMDLDGTISDEDCLDSIADSLDCRFIIRHINNYNPVYGYFYATLNSNGEEQNIYRITIAVYPPTIELSERENNNRYRSLGIKYIIKDIPKKASSMSLIGKVNNEFYLLEYSQKETK